MTITLVVEDGTKVANANTYVSLAAADTYHAAYGNTDWPGADNDEDKKQALILASQSVDLLYGSRYQSGIYPDSSQVFLFPRMYFYDLDGRNVTDSTIPLCLKNAVCEIALMYLNGEDIFPVPNTASNVASESIQVGGIAISTSNFKASDTESFDGFHKVDILLRPILKCKTAGSWRLVA